MPLTVAMHWRYELKAQLSDPPAVAKREHHGYWPSLWAVAGVLAIASANAPVTNKTCLTIGEIIPLEIVLW